MKRVAQLLTLCAALAVGGAARAETFIPFETGTFEAGTDASLDGDADTSLEETDGLDADGDSAVADDADSMEDAADAADTTPVTADSASPEDTFEAAVDSGAADTRPSAIDSTVPTADTGQPAKPPMITENPSDPFSRDPDRDGCTCNAPKTAGDAGAYAAIFALAAVMLRRKQR